MIDLKLSQELKQQLALIPLSELLEDREAAYRDLGYCKLVLVQSPIEWELNRRNV